MYGEESNPESSAERGRTQRGTQKGSTNEPYRSESERYGSQGSSYASDPWQSSRGYEEYGQGGMGQYSGQYSRQYEDKPWNTELGAGQYGSETGSAQSSQGQGSQQSQPSQEGTRSGYPYSGEQIRGSAEQSSRGAEPMQGSGSEMTDYGRERVMQGAMHVPRIVSDESMTEARESSRTTQQGMSSASNQPSGQQGMGGTSEMSNQPSGRQSTGRGFWRRLVAGGQQRMGNQPSRGSQPETGMGSEQCYVDESGNIVDLDPACGQYGRHEYGSQMGYGHEVYQRGEYRVEGQPWRTSQGAGSEPSRRFEQAPSMQQGTGQMRRDVAQPSLGQQQYQPSYGQQAGTQYAATGPEQFGWRRPEEMQGSQQGQRPSEQYQTTQAPSYGQMGSAGMQGEMTDEGVDMAGTGALPLYFQEMRESAMRQMDLEQRQRGMGQQYQPSYQQQNQPSYQQQQSYSQQPSMQFAGTGPEQSRQRSTEEIWGFQEGQRPSEQYQTPQAPSYGQMGSAGMQGEMTDYGREIAIGGMPLYFQEMRSSEMRQRGMGQQPMQRGMEQQQYQPSYQQQAEAPEYGRSGEFGHEGWTGRYGEYGVSGAGTGAATQYGMGRQQEEQYQQPQSSYGQSGTEQYTGAVPEQFGQRGSREMQGELTPVGWEIAMGGMPLYFRDIRSSEMRQRELEERQSMQGQQPWQPSQMGMEQQPSYQGSQYAEQPWQQQHQQYQPSYQRGMEQQPSYQGSQYAQQPWQQQQQQYQPSYQGMGQQAQGPYSQAVSQIPYGQPGMSFTGETFGPAAFSRGSYFGPMGLQQYGEPVQYERIPEPTSPWRGGSQMGMQEQAQQQPTYGQMGMERQYGQQSQQTQQPQQYQQTQQYPYESESSRGKSQYGMGKEQFAHWEGEPCMMGGGTEPYSCNQFVTERYGGGVSPEQPSSGTEPMSRMASSEMTSYGQERSAQGAMPLYTREEEESRMRQQETGQTARYGQSGSMGSQSMGSQPYSGQSQAGRSAYGSQQGLSGETERYRQMSSEQPRTGSGIYPSDLSSASGIISAGAGERYRPAMSEYSGIAPTQGAIGQMYGPTQGDTENLSQARTQGSYYGQGKPYSQEPGGVTSPYGTKPGSVGREGEQMGQTACLMAYETGPYTGQSSYSSQQKGSLADFRKDQCGL